MSRAAVLILAIRIDQQHRRIRSVRRKPLGFDRRFGFRRWPQRLEATTVQLFHHIRRFIAMQLRQIDPCDLQDRSDLVQRRIDEHAHQQRSPPARSNLHSDFAHHLWRDITRALRVEVEAHQIRAGLNCQPRVVEICNATNLYFHQSRL